MAADLSSPDWFVAIHSSCNTHFSRKNVITLASHAARVAAVDKAEAHGRGSLTPNEKFALDEAEHETGELGQRAAEINGSTKSSWGALGRG
jgi:hypothetical protein